MVKIFKQKWLHKMNGPSRIRFMSNQKLIRQTMIVKNVIATVANPSHSPLPHYSGAQRPVLENNFSWLKRLMRGDKQERPVLPHVH